MKLEKKETFLLTKPTLLVVVKVPEHLQLCETQAQNQWVVAVIRSTTE